MKTPLLRLLAKFLSRIGRWIYKREIFLYIGGDWGTPSRAFLSVYTVVVRGGSRVGGTERLGVGWAVGSGIWGIVGDRGVPGLVLEGTSGPGTPLGAQAPAVAGACEEGKGGDWLLAGGAAAGRWARRVRPPRGP